MENPCISALFRIQNIQNMRIYSIKPAGTKAIVFYQTTRPENEAKVNGLRATSRWRIIDVDPPQRKIDMTCGKKLTEPSLKTILPAFACNS